MNRIRLNDVTLRDIFQNTDLCSVDIHKLDQVLENYSQIGFDTVEVLGGSTFEKMLENCFYKSPFQICAYIKKMAPELKLQAQIGGKNLVGVDLYPQDLINKFIDQSIASGIEVFKIYDALNDFKDIEYTAEKVIEAGASFQGILIYEHSRDHRYYQDKIMQLTSMGCSSICIKDVESTLLPSTTAKLFEKITSLTDIPILLSSYNLRGLQVLNYYKACANGGGGVDLSFLPSSYQDYSPTIFAFLLSLKDSSISFNLNWTKALQAFEIVKKNIYPFLIQDFFFDTSSLFESNQSLLPKWLISSVVRQLKEIGEMENINRVIKEIITIKGELGNPTLATPMGQIIASQAILNTLISEKRWEIASDEIKKYLAGYYGKPPRDIKLEASILNSIKDDKYWELPSENLYKQCREELKNITDKPEHILSYCFFPEKTIAFLNKKQPLPPAQTEQAKQHLDKLSLKKLREITDLVETSNIGNINFEVDGVKISINKQPAAAPPSSPEPRKPDYQENLIEVKSPIVGTFYSSPSPQAEPFVKEGQAVSKGDTLCIVEAMKLMNKITAELDGVIDKIMIENEQPVEFGQIIMLIKKEI